MRNTEVKSDRRALERVFTKIDMHGGNTSLCWEWLGSYGGRDKRPRVVFGGKQYYAARLVYELINGDIPSGYVVRHKCDNKSCVNPHHLEVGTHQENMDDMKSRERHGLPHHTVRAIKRLLADKETHANIAAKFGVSRSLVTEINRATVYAHVKEEEDVQD